MSDGRASETALNRALWSIMNERFTDAAADELWARTEVVWGLFAVPERTLGVLGDLRGLDVVELASGTAYFSAWLARAGARPVAVDLSFEQLATAARLQRQHGPRSRWSRGTRSRSPWPSGRRPRRERARVGRVVRPRALAARGGPPAATRRAAGVPHQQQPVGALRARRGGVGHRPAAAGPARGLRGGVAGRRGRVPPVARRLDPPAARRGFVVEAMHEIYAPPEGADHASTRSCRRTGRAGGRPRSSGWPSRTGRDRPELTRWSRRGSSRRSRRR